MFKLNTLKKTSSVVINLGGKVKFPEKFKGTILERWSNYWRNLFIDYRQMLQDLRTDIQDEPKKALIWSMGIATVCALARNNPNEMDFKDYLKRISNDMALVNENCLNAKRIEHVRFLKRSYDEGTIHYKSLGIASIMYTTEMNDSCDIYKGQCSYLKPRYTSFLSHVIDVGFMGRWWNIFIKTNNYDVNF